MLFIKKLLELILSWLRKIFVVVRFVLAGVATENGVAAEFYAKVQVFAHKT